MTDEYVKPSNPLDSSRLNIADQANQLRNNPGTRLIGNFIGAVAGESYSSPEVAEWLRYKKLPSQTKVLLSEWIVHLFDAGVMNDPKLIATSREVINEQATTLYPLVDYVRTHGDEYTFRRFTDKPLHAVSKKPIDVMIQKLLRHNINYPKAAHFTTCIASQPEPDEDKSLAIAVDIFDYPVVLAGIRYALNNADKAPAHIVARLQQMGKKLLGISGTEQRFFTNLNDFYQSFDREYDTMDAIVKANEREVNMVEDVISSVVERKQSEKGDGITVVEVGCGTGRIVNGVAGKNIPGVKRVIGLDVSEGNLKLAQEQYQKLPGEKTEVVYQRGDWDPFTYIGDNTFRFGSKLPMPRDVDMAIFLGRTLAHAESSAMFEVALVSPNVNLTNEGVVLFDMPDPEKGTYLKNRQRLLSILQRIGLPITETFLPQLEYTVDSPNGKDVYNRFTPSPERVIELARISGFECEEVSRAPIDGVLWEGSENVYFAARKKVRNFTGLPQHLRPSTQD